MKRQPSKAPPAAHDSGSRITTASVSSQWAGPLPPPEALDRFNQVVPNGAERIFKMAEVEQAHRLAQEEEMLRVTVPKRNADNTSALPSRFLRWWVRW